MPPWPSTIWPPVLNPTVALDRRHDNAIGKHQQRDQCRWRGQKREMYYQDGPVLPTDSEGGSALVIARYPNKDAAAAIYNFGKGTVSLVGPHPEANQEWYSREGLKNPDGVNLDLAEDLVVATMRHEIKE